VVDVDYPGNDVGMSNRALASPAACRELCAGMVSCTHATHTSSNGRCYLKSGDPAPAAALYGAVSFDCRPAAAAPATATTTTTQPVYFYEGV
jgi:hypothetical protein